MKLDHCHRESCVQIIEALRAENAELKDKVKVLREALEYEHRCGSSYALEALEATEWATPS